MARERSEEWRRAKTAAERFALAESDLERLLERARADLLDDPALSFNTSPALTLDYYIARVLNLAERDA